MQAKVRFKGPPHLTTMGSPKGRPAVQGIGQLKPLPTLRHTLLSCVMRECCVESRLADISVELVARIAICTLVVGGHLGLIRFARFTTFVRTSFAGIGLAFLHALQ